MSRWQMANTQGNAVKRNADAIHDRSKKMRMLS